MADEIHNYGRKTERIIERLNANRNENSQLIVKFYHHLLVNSYSQARVSKYLETLNKLAMMLGRPFESATKDDIAELIKTIELSEYSDWTKRDYKIILKIFYRWFKNSEDYPEEVKWIKVKEGKNGTLPEELLTYEDIEKLSQATNNFRDKALVLVLYESGCRIGEILSLRIKNVRFDEHGAILIVNGKTGSRRVRIIASVPALATWVDNHPSRLNPDSPLWVSFASNGTSSFIGYQSVRMLLRELAIKAGIRKRIYPHIFRHSRATVLANSLTEAQLKHYLGWVQDSNMASIYVHLSGRDIDKALLKLNGIEVEEETKEEKFKLTICPRCKQKNSPPAKFCNSCGIVLDTSAAIELEEVQQKANELMTLLVQQPEALRALVDTLHRLKPEICRG